MEGSECLFYEIGVFSSSRVDVWVLFAPISPSSHLLLRFWFMVKTAGDEQLGPVCRLPLYHPH